MIISRPCALLETFVGRGPSRFLSPRRQFHRQPASQKAKYVAPDRKGPRASGHTCFVLSRAKPSSVTSASVCQQQGHTPKVALAIPTTTFAIGLNYQVSMSFSFSFWVDEMRDTDLCEDTAKFERLVQHLFHRSAHHWSVFL